MKYLKPTSKHHYKQALKKYNPMPDITMCKNIQCSSNKSCLRFTATPNPYYQAYGNYKPGESGKCGYYWPNEKKTQTDKK